MPAAHHSDDSHPDPQSSSEWFDWLEERQRSTLQVYTLEPERLIADFEREQGISRDYEGREILELLQNAADAAEEARVPGRTVTGRSKRSRTSSAPCG